MSFPATITYRQLLSSVLAGALLLYPAVASAQEKVPDSKPQLKINSLEQMRQFEPGVNEEYTLGIGDSISINVANRPEESVQRPVGPDGRVSIPLVGEVIVAGLTRAQAAEAIRQALIPLYTSSIVNIGVDKYGSNKVLLLGDVERPGVVYFDGVPTLLEAITRGGGTAGVPSSTGASSGSGGGGGGGFGGGGGGVIRSSMPSTCVIYRGDHQVLFVELKKMLDSGNAMADMRLRRDDVIYIPSNQEVFVSILGQVQHPGSVNLHDSRSLLTVIADAGGLTPQAGLSPTIRIISPTTHHERTVSFKDASSANGIGETELHGGDVIFVSESTLNKLGYTLQQLTPLTTALTFATILK